MRWFGGIPPLLWAVLLLCASSTSLAQCPQGYSAGSKSGLCLLAGGGPKTFLEAEAFCASNGGHLATIFDKNVLSDVLEACAAANGGNQTCFVGARVEPETRYPNYSSCSIGQSQSEWMGSRWVWRDGCAGVLVDLWSWYGGNGTALNYATGATCTATQVSDGTGLYPALCDRTAGFVCAQPGGCPSMPMSTAASKGTALMAEQVAALQSIKSAVECDAFNLLDSWEGDYACTYRGVYCLSTGEVVGLVLEDFQLQGTLHPAIGNLTQLGFVHIAGNHFAGTLPEEMNQLKLLAELDVSDNEFGGLFPNITGLTGLVYLDMRFNKFFGPIPDWVYSLPLDVLVLNNNNFTGPLSYAVGELKNASLMILAHNSLKSAIPESIGQLQSLAQLLLLNNSLGSNETNITDLSSIDSNTFSEAGPALPYSITNLSTLLLLDVSRNNLEGDLPPTLHRMQGLVEMALSNNIITGEFPPNITALTNLTSLDLSDNVLQGDVAPAFEIPNLKTLVLRGNYLTGTIPKNNITLVDVSGNCIFDNSGGEQKPDDTCAIFYGRVVYEFWRQPKNSENVVLRLWAIRPRYLVRFVFAGGNHTIKGTGSSVDMFHGHGTDDDVRGEGYTFRRVFRGESIYGYTCAVHHNHFGSVRVLEEGELENKTFTFSSRAAICKEANPCAYIGDKAAQCISQPSNADFPFVCSCSAGWTFIGYSCYPGKRRANPYAGGASAGGARGGNNNGVSIAPSASSPGTEKPTLPSPPTTSGSSSSGDASDPCSPGGEYYASCRRYGDDKARCRLEVCNEPFTCLCSPGFSLVKDIRLDGKRMSTCKPLDASGGAK